MTKRFNVSAGEMLGIFAVAILIVFASWVLASAAVWLVWPWVVGDVFAVAVAQGAVPQDLTLWQAMKLLLLVTLLVTPAINSRRKSQ